MVTEAVGRYSDLSRAYARKAREHLAEDDLVQASEKGWGAAAVLVKACAEAASSNTRGIAICGAP